MIDSGKTGWPTGIDAITLFVEDLGETKAWYSAVFAKPPMFEDPYSVVFEVGNTVVNLLHVSAVPELIEPAAAALRTDGSGVVLTLAVDDVDAMATELERRGAMLLNGPMDRPWGIRTASFRDPDGHVWEIARAGQKEGVIELVNPESPATLAADLDEVFAPVDIVLRVEPANVEVTGTISGDDDGSLEATAPGEFRYTPGPTPGTTVTLQFSLAAPFEASVELEVIQPPSGREGIV